MNILITSAGRRVSLVRSFQKELKKIDSNSKVIAVDANPTLSAACHAADGFFKVPRLDHPGYIDELVVLCKANSISLIIPTIDTELLLLAENKERLAAYGIKSVVASIDFIAKCRDKRKIHKFFTDNSVEIANEYSKENYKLPMFLKPWDGSRSVDTFLIKSESDLTDYQLEHPKLMFLEYLDHKLYDEYTCDLYYSKDHKLKCVVPRKRISVRDGEVNKGLTVNNDLVDYIRERLSYIDGVVGCITVQFFKHITEPKIFGIEVNPRFGGGYPLSYLAGANYSKWIIEEYLLDKEIPESFDCWEDNLLMIRYDHEILVHGYQD